MLPPALEQVQSQLRQEINSYLEEFVQEKATQLHLIDPQLAEMSQALLDLVSQGKRLRPLFAFWGWQAASVGLAPSPDRGQEQTRTQVIAACACLELLQACALIHDDVMDASALRRGRPTVHRRFAAMHQQHQWQGSSRRFGMAAAILLGDLALGWTDEMFFQSGLPPHMLLRAKPALDAMRSEVSAGQYLDVLAQAQAQTDPSAIEAVLTYKSAKYTVERPLHLGALLAGAEAAVLQTCSNYAVAIGQAFQLRDDLLGVFGDPALTGKPAGDDLREGKRTLLVSTALQLANSSQRDTLNQALGDPELAGEKLTQARKVLQETGAAIRVEARIDTLRAQALDALKAGRDQLDPQAFVMLEHLAQAATQRQY